MAGKDLEIKLNNLKREVLDKIKRAGDLVSLENIRIKTFGRKGELTLILKSIPKLNLAARAHLGQRLNDLKDVLTETIRKREQELKDKALEQKFKTENIDITVPGRRIDLGHIHPLTIILRRIEGIFESMGFSVVNGPEIESERYNFNALNIPQDHPARDMQDTFWLRDNQKNQKPETRNPKPYDKNQKFLLRTHTSPMQVKYMEKNNPPFRIIVPGRVFRYEATDASHDIQFHQVEGLMVDKNASLANLKAVLEEFFKRLFAREVKIRFRPGYFPFVEPGLEVDIQMTQNSTFDVPSSSRGKFKTQNWLEVAGAGMVHPKVFESARLVPTEWQGFAFGMGLERLTMLYYGIDDIRLFHSGDLRFLKQF